MMQFLLRYMKFVAVGTPVIFVLILVVLVAQRAIYGTDPRSDLWDNAWQFFVLSAFLAAILGISRPVVPYLRDPEHGRRGPKSN